MRFNPAQLRPGFFHFAQTILFGILFWVVESSLTHNPAKICWWALGGGAFGFLSGYFWRFLLATRYKPVLLASILLAEFVLGLFLIGPGILLGLYFIPTSNLHSICCETPKDYGATEFEKISVNTADKATIAGWYVAPTSQTGKVIILIHGYGYDRRGTDFQTRILIAAGYGVLLYDLRDHGESTGPLNLFNRMDRYQHDLQDVLTFLRAKPGIGQIGLVGISLGSFATLNLPATQLNQFAGLWLDGLRFENFGAKQPIQNPIDYLKRLLEDQSYWIATKLYDNVIVPEPQRFTQIIPNITRPPLMLVASGKDPSERATNEQLAPLLGKNQQLWIIENAWHIGGRFDAPEEYKIKLLAFFAKAFAQVDARK